MSGTEDPTGDCPCCGCPQALWLLQVHCANRDCALYSEWWGDELEEEAAMIVIWWLLKERRDR